MNKINYDVLEKIVNSFKSNFENHRKDELYKFEAIKTFQDNWNIDADDFVEMLKKAFSNTYNLLNSNRYYPQKMIFDFAKKEPNVVKDMFAKLFDEKINLTDRYYYFIKKSEWILRKYWPKDKHHFQDAHAISVYLTFKYPEKYYMYKASVDKKVANILGLNIFNKNMVITLNNYFNMCNDVLKYISKDKELIKMHKDSLDNKCYLDKNLHVLVWDILFYGGVRYTEENNVKFDEKEILKDNISNDRKPNYFWLNANPKIWSFSELEIGEIIEYTAISENGHKRQVYKNYLSAKKGDIIIAYESYPTKMIVGLCVVDQDFGEDEILYARKTETLLNPIPYNEFSDAEELRNMEYIRHPQGSLFKIENSEYDFLIDLIREYNPKENNKKSDKYQKTNFLADVFIDSEKYDEMRDLLLTKKNIILQGVPGVGKTYMAKRLAYSIIEAVDDEKVMCIQFHQNYSYEDFIEGYRPSEETFELQEGVFYRFCKMAKNDLDNKYFFIIDEINRGNLSKIFGELLMLIEADKRNERLTLAYSKQKFSIPENVYVIGMMNTADRSLAIMDYALRRRFCFYDVEPIFDQVDFVKYIKSFNNKMLDKTVENIKKLNDEIEDDSSLGKGFKIGHSYFCDLHSDKIEKELKVIIKYQILPMLEEYWFDDKKKYEKWKAILLGENND